MKKKPINTINVNGKYFVKALIGKNPEKVLSFIRLKTFDTASADKYNKTPQ